jgi:hypothetical protein
MGVLVQLSPSNGKEITFRFFLFFDLHVKKPIDQFNYLESFYAF